MVGGMKIVYTFNVPDIWQHQVHVVWWLMALWRARTTGKGRPGRLLILWYIPSIEIVFNKVVICCGYSGSHESFFCSSNTSDHIKDIQVGSWRHHGRQGQPGRDIRKAVIFSGERPWRMYRFGWNFLQIGCILLSWWWLISIFFNQFALHIQPAWQP